MKEINSLPDGTVELHEFYDDPEFLNREDYDETVHEAYLEAWFEAHHNDTPLPEEWEEYEREMNV